VRICLIVYGGLDVLSGGTLYDRRLVDYLQSAGETVEVIALPPWGGRLAYARALVDADRARRAALGAVHDARPDVLLIDELCHPSLFLAADRLRRAARYPLAAIVHHLRISEARPAWQNALYGLVERRFLRAMDGFITNSEATRLTVERNLLDPRPFIIAPPAGDRLGEPLSPARIAARADEPGPLRIVFVGNVIPRKGLDLLITALGRLPHADWRLTAVGSLTVDARYAGALRRQIDASGLAGNITLPGRLPDAALADILATSHVLAVPSTYEGFGIVYVEGMAFGLPALASADGGAYEIVTHGVDGYLIPPGDVAALADHLAALHADRDSLRRMALAARARFDRHPTWAESAARIHDWLRTFVRMYQS
jgi:glycosyltransferase involved in cell wall biosynthesis